MAHTRPTPLREKTLATMMQGIALNKTPEATCGWQVINPLKQLEYESEIH